MGKKVGTLSGGRTRHYRELVVWRRAMELAREVYAGTEAFPKNEMFGLQIQLRRAAVSVPSNLAEGHGRLNDGHFRQFLANARGSLFELQTQLELANGLGFIESDRFNGVMEKCEDVARLINGLLRALEE